MVPGSFLPLLKSGSCLRDQQQALKSSENPALTASSSVTNSTPVHTIQSAQPMIFKDGSWRYNTILQR